jgi:hypothetical protein
MLDGAGFQELIQRRKAFICVKQDESAHSSGDLLNANNMDGANTSVLYTISS